MGLKTRFCEFLTENSFVIHDQKLRIHEMSKNLWSFKSRRSLNFYSSEKFHTTSV